MTVSMGAGIVEPSLGRTIQARFNSPMKPSTKPSSRAATRVALRGGDEYRTFRTGAFRRPDAAPSGRRFTWEPGSSGKHAVFDLQDLPRVDIDQ